MAVDWLGFGYAALVASGGIIGYAKAGRAPKGASISLPLPPRLLLPLPNNLVGAGQLFTKASYLEVDPDVNVIGLCHVLITCCCWGVVHLS